MNVEIGDADMFDIDDFAKYIEESKETTITSCDELLMYIQMILEQDRPLDAEQKAKVFKLIHDFKNYSSDKIRMRTPFTETQRNILIHYFQQNDKLSEQVLKQIMSKTGLTHIQVKYWFQRTRRRGLREGSKTGQT